MKKQNKQQKQYVMLHNGDQGEIIDKNEQYTTIKEIKYNFYSEIVMPTKQAKMLKNRKNYKKHK